jgi:hypothetical protein
MIMVSCCLDSSTLKMEAESSSKMLISFYQTAWRQILEDHNL